MKALRLRQDLYVQGLITHLLQDMASATWKDGREGYNSTGAGRFSAYTHGLRRASLRGFVLGSCRQMSVCVHVLSRVCVCGLHAYM